MSGPPQPPAPPAKQQGDPTEDYRGPDADTLHDYDLRQFRAERGELEDEAEEPTPTGTPVGEQTATVDAPPPDAAAPDPASPEPPEEPQG